MWVGPLLGAILAAGVQFLLKPEAKQLEMEDKV